MNFENSSPSNQSDDAKSTVSSLSAVSIYGEEFAELRHLIDPDKYPIPTRNCSTPVCNDSGCDVGYEDRFADLSFQLQSTLKLNEKYKNDMFNLEKNMELRYHDKIETLLKNNKHLKVELVATNEKINSLFKKFTSTPSSTADKSFVQLEKKYHDLSVSNFDLEANLHDVLKEKSFIEITNKQLKIELEDCKIDNETKSGCTKELKEKISQQFMEIQALIRSRNINIQSLNESKFELEHLIKFQEWSKEQLNAAQADKKILIENLTHCKSELLAYKEKLDNATVDVKMWKNKFECLQLDSLKSKEKLYQEIKNFSLENTQKIVVEEKCTCTDQALLNYYESNISDLKNEISTIKELVAENDNTIKKLNKENSGLTSRYLILQKTAQQKDLSLEEFGCIKQQLNLEMNLLKQKYFEKSLEVSELKNNIGKIEAEILVKREENDVIENNIRIVRQQFFVFKQQYDKLKNDILEKNKQIFSLQNEKQELFMNNNWKVCELEKSKEKDIFIQKLKQEISDKNLEIVEYLNNSKELQNNYQEICKLNHGLIEEKNNIIKCHNEEIERYEKVLVQYKETVQHLENQISRSEEIQTENARRIREKEENLTILLNEIHNRDLDIAQLKKCRVVDFSGRISEQMKINHENRNEIVQFREKIRNVDTRINSINEKVQNCSSMLSNLQLTDARNTQNNDNGIRELKVLLQVKQLELKEKQKKYERNNHTLLRKVKEHMKGRNLAEKHNKYLQELYDNVCNENNSLKLTVTLIQEEQENDKKCISKYINLNNNLKEKLLSLECEYKKREICTQCFEYKIVCERLHNLEKFVKDLDKEKILMQDLILEKESSNLSLINENSELKQQVSNIHGEQNNFIKKSDEILFEKNKLLKEKFILENRIKQLDESMIELNLLLKKENEVVSQKNDHISLLEKQIEDANFKMICMKNNIDDLNTTLQAKTEELMFLEKESSLKSIEGQKKGEESKFITDALKESLQELQAEMNLVNSEKHFLQRLCSDLKLALKSHVNYNKILKEQLSQMPKEKPNFSSLPNNVLPSTVVTNQCNEDFIHELLHRQKDNRGQKPFVDLQLSLNNLRQEITVLQDQILKKNNTSG